MGSLILATAAWVARLLPPRARSGLYRLGPISRGVRRLLNAAAPQGTTEITVAAGPLAGARLELDLHTEKDLWLGTYEPGLMQAIREFVQPGEVAFDVGAQLGYVSLALARRVGPSGRVTAFEPIPWNVARLRRNLELNPEGERVRPVEAAVGRQSGPGRFLAQAQGGLGKLEGADGRRFEPASTLEVAVVSLDEWVFGRGEAAPSLVKVDVEGGEAQVLEGMVRLLREIRPRLLIELHGPEAAQATRTLLADASYRVHAMRAGYPEWQPVGWKGYVVGMPAGAGRLQPRGDRRGGGP